jgi:hypothetical protein
MNDNNNVVDYKGGQLSLQTHYFTMVENGDSATQLSPWRGKQNKGEM